MTLTLHPNEIFFLRQTYLGTVDGERSFPDWGRFALSGDGPVLVLYGGRESGRKFAIKSANEIRMLDKLGGEIDSELDYSLARLAALDPFEDRLRLRGMYSYMADAGLFTECLTGKRFPVVQEGDNAALERAYAKERIEPGEPILVAVEGRFAMRPGMAGMEGSGDQVVVLVDRFERADPGVNCGGDRMDEPLFDTHWKLTELDAVAVPELSDEREPHLVLTSEENRASGSSGCNRFTGAYQIEGEAPSGSAPLGLRVLRFGPLASTRRMCLEGMDIETRFLRALAQTAQCRVTGDVLELLSQESRVLARLVARKR